jgi:hypothetical protein
MHRTLVLLAVTLLPPTLSGAQSPARPPLVVSRVTQKGSEVSFDLTNVSQKAVRADAITCELRGTHGQSLGELQQTAVYGLAPEIFASAFDAGLTHQERFGGIPANRNGQADSCALSVDYVLFTDGSTWGLDKRKASIKIRGIIAGYDQAVLQLQAQLNRTGADAVLQYIRQFKPVR